MTRSQIFKLIMAPYYIWRLARDILFCIWKFGRWNKTWRFHRLPLVRKHPNATIEIGNNFTACSNAKNNSIGVFQKVILNALEPNAVLKIGNNVGISGATISCENEVTLGNNVLIGSGVLITDSDAHPIHPNKRNDKTAVSSSPIVIEDDAFIGARSIILKGVTIGRGSVIGAGSVVVKPIPPMCIAAGNPAIVIRNIE
ncbi:acyltransferase [Mangrovibacterium sp.]|uniref:acyltransferase n=1 Tax=Mangrovibacterium sp. TaxID=1961364 RepID=UPI0035637451